MCVQVLCIQGFLVCRKHADRILLLAEMMAGSGFPCFKGGARTVQQLRRRFHLNVPEAQVRAAAATRVSGAGAATTRQEQPFH